MRRLSSAPGRCGPIPNCSPCLWPACRGAWSPPTIAADGQGPSVLPHGGTLPSSLRHVRRSSCRPEAPCLQPKRHAQQPDCKQGLGAAPLFVIAKGYVIFPGGGRQRGHGHEAPHGRSMGQYVSCSACADCGHDHPSGPLVAATGRCDAEPVRWWVCPNPCYRRPGAYATSAGCLPSTSRLADGPVINWPKRPAHQKDNVSPAGPHWDRNKHHTASRTKTAVQAIEIIWGFWSERRDSNPRPPVPQTGALPDCATLRCVRWVRRGAATCPVRWGR
jgi:hypothetical protein